MFKAREPVDLVLILNVHDHGPVHVPHVDPLELRVAIGQEPDVVSDHVKCKYNARSHYFSVRGAVRYKSLLKKWASNLQVTANTFNISN